MGCLGASEGGFDNDAVRAAFGLADALTPVVVLAIGRHDGPAGLPGPLAARETAPRTRRPLGDLLLPAHQSSLRVPASFEPRRCSAVVVRKPQIINPQIRRLPGEIASSRGTFTAGKRR